MRFQYCPHCGKKAELKEIGDEGLIPYCAQWVKFEDAPGMLREGSIAWQLVKMVAGDWRKMLTVS